MSMFPACFKVYGGDHATVLQCAEFMKLASKVKYKY